MDLLARLLLYASHANVIVNSLIVFDIYQKHQNCLNSILCLVNCSMQGYTENILRYYHFASSMQRYTENILKHLPSIEMACI